MLRNCLVILAVCLISIPAIASTGSTLPPGLSGKWQGSGRIIVDWSHQKQLRLDLVFHDDGRVTGRIGDATIDDGSVTTRSALMRWLGNGDYLISGSLQGPIIAAEGITRDGVMLMVSPRNSQLRGSMHSTGSKFGGKNRMVFTVVEITLDRSSD